MYDPHAEERKRREQLINLMTTKAMEPRRIESAGGRVVPYGLGEGLTQIAQALLARNSRNRLNTDEEEDKAESESQRQEAIDKIKEALTGKPQKGGPLNSYTQGKPQEGGPLKPKPYNPYEPDEYTPFSPEVKGEEYQQFEPEVKPDADKAAWIAATNPQTRGDPVIAELIKNKQYSGGKSQFYTYQPDAQGNLVRLPGRPGENPAYVEMDGNKVGAAKWNASLRGDVKGEEEKRKLEEKLNLEPEIVKQKELSKNEAEKIIEQPKIDMKLSGKDFQLKELDNTIDKAIDQAGFFTTGVPSQLIGWVGGTPQYNLGRTLDTIKANLGLDKLQQIRDESPTGGALGQVTEAEHRLLQSVWASVDQAQDSGQLKENLEKVRKQAKESWNRISEAYKQTYGKPFSDFPNYIEIRTLKDGRKIGKKADGSLELINE